MAYMKVLKLKENHGYENIKYSPLSDITNIVISGSHCIIKHQLNKMMILLIEKIL